MLFIKKKQFQLMRTLRWCWLQAFSKQVASWSV